jgi:hypothetical protein
MHCLENGHSMFVIYDSPAHIQTPDTTLTNIVIDYNIESNSIGPPLVDGGIGVP